MTTVKFFQVLDREALYRALLDKGMPQTEAFVAALEWENPRHAAAQKLVDKAKGLLEATEG